MVELHDHDHDHDHEHFSVEIVDGTPNFVLDPLLEWTIII
jgi:hypothetical protein